AVAVPAGLGSRRDLVVGAAGLHRAGVVLGVPAGHGVLVALVEQQPPLAPRPVAVGAHEHEATPQLLGLDVEVQLAGGDGGGRVVGAHGRPRAAVPDVAAAVLARRDDALEVGVLDRVV